MNLLSRNHTVGRGRLTPPLLGREAGSGDPALQYMPKGMAALGRPGHRPTTTASSRFQRRAGFTLVELLIGLSLSLIIMGGVLSSYVFLGRNFTRSLGISSTNQPNLETQGRRTLAYFTQDVRMASGIDTSGVSPNVLPSASGVTLVLPTSSGTTTVTYVYDSTAQTLTRTPASGTAQIMHTNLLSCTLNYYDNTGKPYTIFVVSTSGFSSFSGIKQLSMTFSSQAGSSVNGTLTQIYQSASSRLIIRNKQLPL
jgi:prepilin-type N-terminal cleavage/methylation domain-containing protein